MVLLVERTLMAVAMVRLKRCCQVLFGFTDFGQTGDCIRPREEEEEETEEEKMKNSVWS